jgi:hypothetical protein
MQGCVIWKRHSQNLICVGKWYMRRIHAFEFNDLSWFPISFRNAATDFLQFVANRFDIYKNVLPVIEKGIQNSGVQHDRGYSFRRRRWTCKNS